MITTYTLPQLVDMGLAPSADWLSRRLNSGEISGYKVGRKWLMSEDDVAEMLANRRNPTRKPSIGGFTQGSQKRRTA